MQKNSINEYSKLSIPIKSKGRIFKEKDSILEALIKR